MGGRAEKLQQLERDTRLHWAAAHEKQRARLDKIHSAPDGATLVHQHSIQRLPRGLAQQLYQNHTIGNHRF